MSLFSRNFFEADASSFTPLFRLLDDFDTYTRQGGTHHSGRASLALWQPKFDVRETELAYELHGELPGMNKDTVQIEFTEPQTMCVRGRAERSYSEGSPTGQIEDLPEKPAITEGGEQHHKATVEDEGAAGKEQHGAVEKAKPKQPQTLKPRYWLTERSVGEFSRTFNFPSPVDHNAVSANFKDGILSVCVPKAKKPESRRIAIH